MTPCYSQPYFHRVCHMSTRVTCSTITSIQSLKKFHLLSCTALAQLFGCCLMLRNVLQTHQCCIGTLHKSGSSYLQIQQCCAQLISHKLHHLPSVISLLFCIEYSLSMNLPAEPGVCFTLTSSAQHSTCSSIMRPV